MVAPKKMIMGRGESAVSIGRARSIARKPVVKVKPKTKTKVAEPKSNVKVNTTPWSRDEVKEFQGSYNKAIASSLERAKSGATARKFAQGVRELNKTVKKSKTIKINPAKRAAKKNRNIQ